jgi:mannose-6-phosphate isomerase-like protein (cupin superfamily)
MEQASEIANTFIHLCDGGDAEKIKLSPAFWRGNGGTFDRVVGVFEFKSARDLHDTMEEMHPGGDEVLLLISGAIEVVLEDRSIALEAGQFAIVPRGVWHRLVMRKPGQLLFINSRTGMETRRVKTARTKRTCS